MISEMWQPIILVGIIWPLWRIVRPYVVRSPLDNVPGPPSPSLLKGNISQLFHRKNAWEFQRSIGEKYGSVVRVTQLFGERALFVFDPKALQSIVVKDQYLYERTTFDRHFRNIALGPGILSVTGDRHRLHRKSLNPVFSIAHMRYMTPVFYEVMHKLRTAIHAEVHGASGEVDMLVWMGRAALELIGQGGLGYSFDPLVADMRDTFGQALKSLQPSVAKLRVWIMCSQYLPWLGPAWFRHFVSKLIPGATFRHVKSVIDTISSQSWSIYLDKKEALLKGDEELKHQVGQGKDIMSVLLRMNLDAPEDERLSEDEVIAQMSTFVLAATDTTSSALSRTLHLLAQRPEVQEKLREEILDARDGRDLEYDSLVALPYLDAVCRETLRLYPPIMLARRETIQDVVMPLSKPIRGVDGSLMNEIFVPRGTLVITGNWASNTNKELWGEDADEWKPERWSSSLPDALKEARIPGIYSNLMSFLGGSRACIGFKFSQLEMKVVLSILLASFRFSPSDKPISWNFANTVYPTVGGEEVKPALPLKVEVLRD